MFPGEVKYLSHFLQGMFLGDWNQKRWNQEAWEGQKIIRGGGRQGRSPGFNANVGSRTETRDREEEGDRSFKAKSINQSNKGEKGQL